MLRRSVNKATVFTGSVGLLYSCRSGNPSYKEGYGSKQVINANCVGVSSHEVGKCLKVNYLSLEGCNHVLSVPEPLG